MKRSINALALLLAVFLGLPRFANFAAAQTPQDYRSQNFLLHTDLPAKEANELLERLETMVALISTYWEKPCAGAIECYVVQDLKRWPEGSLHPRGAAKIAEGAGVTITEVMSLNGKKLAAKSVVYATANRGTPQHEAVHAYCGQTFGSSGPTWYAEGMAEMGQYWQAGEQGVRCQKEVIDYLRNTKPQSLRTIVDPKVVTGDSWQNYAWRWALCHVLSHNPNYADRFRPLGLAFLNEQPATFDDVFGAVAARISFEYLFFVTHVEEGLRADLISIDWKRKFKNLTQSMVVSKVQANRGWQPTGATVAKGDPIAFSASGVCRLSSKGAGITADGKAQLAGDAASSAQSKHTDGRLVGAVMYDFQLSEEFELGAYGEARAPADGKLYVRCRDRWTELADNSGTLTLRIKLADPKSPLARPEVPQPAAPRREGVTAKPKSRLPSKAAPSSGPAVKGQPAPPRNDPAPPRNDPAPRNEPAAPRVAPAAPRIAPPVRAD